MHLHQRGFSHRLKSFFRDARSEILIASPFVGDDGTKLAINNLSGDFRNTGRLTLLTDLRPRNIYQCATDPFAIRSLCHAVTHSAVRYLPSLHAKVYVADETVAIVTSANFTAGGIYRNYEYGVEINDRGTVGEIRNDVLEYSSLGSDVGTDRLDAICAATEELRALYASQLKSVSSAASKAFDKRLQETED